MTSAETIAHLEHLGVRLTTESEAASGWEPSEAQIFGSNPEWMAVRLVLRGTIGGGTRVRLMIVSAWQGTAPRVCPVAVAHLPTLIEAAQAVLAGAQPRSRVQGTVFDPPGPRRRREAA